MRSDDIVGGERHYDPVRMARCLLIDAVDQVHGPLGVVSSEVRFHPDREELRAQITCLDLAEVHMSGGDGSVLAEIKVFVEKALRRVRVSINHDGGIVNCLRRICARCAWRLLSQRKCGYQQEEKTQMFGLHSPVILASR